MVHFRYGLDPLTTRRGLSPLSAALREICTDNEINNYAASLMRNMGVPGLVVSPKDANTIIPFGDEQKIQARFESAFTGDERGQTLVNTVPLDIQMPGFNPDQMAIEFLRKVPEERVAALLGLPAGVVGLGAGLDRNTFNNYAEARKAAFENNIAPTQKLMAEAMDRQLLPDFEDVASGETYVGWDYRRVRVLQEDENSKAERVALLFEKDLVKRGEGRREMGFQSKPEDDLYFSEIDTKNKVEIAKNTPKPVAAGGSKPAKKEAELDSDQG